MDNIAAELQSAKDERDRRVRAAFARYHLRQALPNQYLEWLTLRRYLLCSTSLAIGTVLP